MIRINFLAPNKAISRTIAAELLLARIEARHIHVLAKEGTPMPNSAAPSLKFRPSRDVAA
jgi:hypothetical protein